MNPRISGDNCGVFNADLPAGKVGDDATSFPDQQTPRRNVPRRQALLPEAVEPARSHIGQIQRRRARSPDAARSGGYAAKLPLVFRQSRQISERKTGRDQRKLRVRDR